MKLDLTRLPVGEAIIGFLMVALAVTFVLGFIAIEDGDGADGASETPAPTDGAGTPTPGGTEIVLHDNSFDPDALTVAAGETATFSITNEGIAIHNVRFSGDDGEYDTDDDAVSEPDLIRGGETATIEWIPTAAGEYPFRCDFHPTEMTGTITVQ